MDFQLTEGYRAGKDEKLKVAETFEPLIWRDGMNIRPGFSGLLVRWVRHAERTGSCEAVSH